MAEPVFHVGEIPSGIHQMRSDRVPKHVDVAAACREIRGTRVDMKDAVDLPTGDRRVRSTARSEEISAISIRPRGEIRTKELLAARVKWVTT